LFKFVGVCLFSGSWPCGSSTENSCFANTGGNTTEDSNATACSTTCSNSEHYTPDTNTGRCKVIEACENRT
jgi:hypothetical protein